MRACLQKTLASETKNTGAVSFSPDGRLLASGIPGGVRFWNVANWQEWARYLDHRNALEVYSIAFNPEGKTVVSVSPDQTFQTHWVQRLLTLPTATSQTSWGHIKNGVY